MGDSKYTPNPRKYYKTNFVDLVELITPEVYKMEDLYLSGTEVNPLSQVINAHINVAANISNVISLSGVANSQTSALDSIDGIAQYFVKQNKLTNINPFLFESKIMLPLGTSLADYDTSGEFFTYLSGTLLPMIIPASTTQVDPLQANITTLSALTGDSNTSSVHNYLVDTLGWMYFLNTSADGGLDYSPSSYVLNSLNSLYMGTTLETIDGIKGLTEYLWRNNETCSFGSYIPDGFASGIADGITESSAGVLPTYTSGTQRLDALKTLMEVVYSPLYIDEQDYTVKSAFDNYIDASMKLDNRVSNGPHRKFTNIMGYEFADLNDQVENIGLIYDIDNVKGEHLQYIADLIGFKLRGSSASKWRHQLRLALDLYKKSGTLESIQVAINTLIVDSVFDVSGRVQELWESYLPQLIWYALGTESPLFRDLNTWTPGLANQAGVFSYSTSSLEDNIKMVTDSILLDMYKAFPDNFLFHGNKFPVPQFAELDINGCTTKRYTIINEPGMKPFHMHSIDSNGYQAYKQDAKLFGESKAFDAATGFGALGSGVYMAGEEHLTTGERPLYLKPEGDLNFLFSYRGKQNFGMPPFEEVKYYRDSSITADMVNFLVERLKCFMVKDSFADEVGNYILSSAVTDESDLGALNEMLMFFSSVQIPSNFNDVMLSISDYEKNLLPLWNGKSSHLFINFKDTDFDFSKTTLEGDGKYALYEAARVAKEFSPAHAITRVNLTASAEDDFSTSSANWEYLGFDKDDNRASYTSASVLGNFEISGAAMGLVAPGNSDGRGGLNTFKRDAVDRITDALESTTTATFAPRRALRRRNFKYTLPKEGYYDRTGFNGPVNWDASAQENSMPSSLGELTLGYVASAAAFYPVVDPINPSGVWHECEKLDSSRQFSGVYTSATYPYRGLTPLGSNNKMPEEESATARYVDRGQVPELYNTMHQLFEAKAYDYANEQINLNTSPYDADAYWKNNRQSFANEAIASGFVLNSFADYENFSFGTGLQKAHRDYCKYFNKHSLGLNEIAKTGGNIFAQVFGKGLYNCDFDLTGYAATTLEGNYIASSVANVVPIAYNDGSGVFSTCAVASYGDGIASGTYIAYGPAESVLPLVGNYVSPFDVNTAQYSNYQEFNAEFRNPNILSGIEFVQTSGAPNANQFSVFKLDSSKATPGMENALINNSVIKCKSLGGLPRLRFDLSSYGDRPNHFIKDHKFKLNVKSLVAEENSPILGGGKLGVWIHTKPKYLGNRNLLSYTDDPGSSPGLDFPAGDGNGNYWGSQNANSFSSILETNPFGGVSSMELSGMNTSPGPYTFLIFNPESVIEGAGFTTRPRNFRTGYNSIWSMYVKRPTSGYSPSSFFLMINDRGDPEYGVNNVYFDYQGTYTDSTSAVLVPRDVPLGIGYRSSVEDVGNNWYRCSLIVSGLGYYHADRTLDGDQFDNRIYMTSSTDSPGYPNYSERLLLYGPQVEQWPIGTGGEAKTGPTPYEAVVGDIPDPVTPNGYLWSWTPNGKWEVIKESRLSIPAVKNSLAHIYDFPIYQPALIDEEFCLGNTSDSNEVINNNTLKNLKEEYFRNFEIEFDTRNFTKHNNSEYLDIVPMDNDVYEVTEQVNRDDTNYIVEVFFIPNTNPDKYLLIDSIELQDVTQRENTGIATGHGVATSGIPLRPFVTEDKLYLEKDQLRDVLKFYNGLAGLGTGMYATSLASRDAMITSGTMEVSGGSRLNYRLSPTWGAGNAGNTQADYNNFTNVELDN